MDGEGTVDRGVLLISRDQDEEIQKEDLRGVKECAEQSSLKMDPNKWSDPKNRRVAMASLVSGVYKMERRRKKGDTSFQKIAEWWETLGYTLRRPVYEDNETPTGNLIAAVFEHQLDDGPPKVVVAMRGTIVTCPRDLETDIYILLCHLTGHKRFHTVHDVVNTEVARFGADRVTLTGHSKGAALALLVGRHLAEKGDLLECHLFNPPNPTVPPTILPPHLTQLRHVLNAVNAVHDVLHNVAATTLSHVFVDKEKRLKTAESFRRISPWFPTLYVNPEDPISAAYITYFDAQQFIPALKASSEILQDALSSSPRSIRAIWHNLIGLPEFRPDHLIPSAQLVVNTQMTAKFKFHRAVECFLGAHTLRQWLDHSLDLDPAPFKFDPDAGLVTVDHSYRHRFSPRRIGHGIKQAIHHIGRRYKHDSH